MWVTRAVLALALRAPFGRAASAPASRSIPITRSTSLRG